jgi:sirohydrochlorin cobaltochelatase
VGSIRVRDEPPRPGRSSATAPGEGGTRPALLVVGHGTTDPEGVAQLHELVRQVRLLDPVLEVASGFIELAEPSAGSALDTLVAGGARTVVAVPLVLSGAGHRKLDGPAIVHDARARHPDAQVLYARELGIHPLVLEAAADRIREALDALTDARAARGGEARGGEARGGRTGEGGPRERATDRAHRPGPAGDGGRVAAPNPGCGPAPEAHGDPEHAVLLVGRGSTDPDANADLYKVARLLSDSRGLGLVEPAFVSLARPFVADGLERCRRLGARRIAVVPYFLFTGVLARRIGTQARAFARGARGLEVVVGRELGPDPRLARLVLERYAEALEGPPAVNCDCCVYRVPLPGYERRARRP